MERNWREAWVRGDAEALDRIHADDYLVINYLGQVNTKAQVMADVRAGAFKYKSMEHKDVVMRVYDNVVIVNARTVNKGHRQERDVGGEFSYTRVYSEAWRPMASGVVAVRPFRRCRNIEHPCKHPSMHARRIGLFVRAPAG